jgi:fructose-bisphosphate aldolase class II
MEVNMALLDHRPDYIKTKLGANNKIALLNSKDILNILKDSQAIVMACNIRIKHVIPGIMKAAQELNAVVAFELAKSEGDLEGGYTGMTPKIFVDTIIDYANQINFTTPFFIHGDHITVKNDSEKEIETAEKLINAELDAGYTSFAIDASFNPIPKNIEITTRLAKKINEHGIGLEVEVGEVKSVGSESEVTTVEEAQEFIYGLRENKITANLLAINNGSKHGNYLEGEQVHIDLERTREIYNIIKPFGMSIAQHGITGTPLHLIKKFSEYGIRKGNVGTQWQNIAHEGLPQDLFNTMKAWAKENKKDIKFATKQFKKEIDNIPESNKKIIETKAYEEAKNFIKAFSAEGSANIIKNKLD